MTPIIKTGAVIARRSHAISPGAIAGAVIGSVLGGGILLIVLGFIYFRYRRQSKLAQAEDGLPIPKASAPLQALPAFERSRCTYPRDPVVPLPDGRPPSVKDDRFVGTVPVLQADPTSQTPTISQQGDDWMTGTNVYAHQPVGYIDTLPQDISFSLPARQQTFPITLETTTTLPLNHVSTAPEAANSSYYDPRISMGSEPPQDNTPPSRQMSDLYEAQLREAEEHRRNSSIQRRIWDTIARRQSSRTSRTSRTSKVIISGAAQSPTSPHHMGASPLTNPAVIKQEPAESPRGAEWQGFPITSNYVEEPEDFSSEGVGDLSSHVPAAGRQDPQLSLQYGRYERQTQDSQYPWFMGRNDSTVRQTTESDAALPSLVLRADSTYGLPLEAQPQLPIVIQQQDRLKSPDIPEPMEGVVLQPEPDINGHSPFRSSNSPQLSPDPFTIFPMAILHPATPAEQAALTTYQINHSATPPAIPPPPPEIITQTPTQEDAAGPPSPKGDDFADMYLDLPSDDEHRRSSDSYEYPTTPGQSSTGESRSSGRTPDTRPTVSPSPFPSIPEQGMLKPDPGTSPYPSKSSPQPGLLICPECGREFDQIHKLNHHKRYHDRTHECTYPGCDKKFGTKTHLHRHINDRHLKLKAYHCTEPTCQWFKGGKSFPRKDNWRRHMIKKHGSTPQDFDAMELSLE